MDSLFPNEIFLEIFKCLSPLDLFRGFYNLNSRLNKIISDIPINVGFALNAEQQKYVLPNVHPAQIRSFCVPEEKFQYSKLKQCSNIRELKFLAHASANPFVHIQIHDHLKDVKPDIFPYLTKLSISHQDAHQTYNSLCLMIYGGEFPMLKHVDLPYANASYHSHVINWSTKLTYVRIGCCNKSMLYPLLENLPNLEIFHCGEIGTPSGAGPLKTARLALKELHLTTYDALWPNARAHPMMLPAEMVRLFAFLPNLVHASLRVTGFGNLENALGHLSRVLSQCKNLKTFYLHITYNRPTTFQPSITVMKDRFPIFRNAYSFVRNDSQYSVCEFKQDARTQIKSDLFETRIDTDSWPAMTTVETVFQQLNSLRNRLTVEMAKKLCSGWPFIEFYDSNIIHESRVMKAYLELLLGIVRLVPRSYFFGLFPKGCGGCAVFQLYAIVALHPGLDKELQDIMKILLNDEQERLLSLIPTARRLAQLVRNDYHLREFPFPYAASCLYLTIDLTRKDQGSVIVCGLGAMIQNENFLLLMENNDEKAILVAKKMFYDNKTDFFFSSQLCDFLKEVTDAPY